MYYALVGTVVGIGEQRQPIRWQSGDVDSKPMVLSGDGTPPTVSMETRLVVPTITIPTGTCMYTITMVTALWQIQ